MSADASLACTHCGSETTVRADPVFDFACTACGGPRLEYPVHDTRTRSAIDRKLSLAKEAAEQPSWAARVALVAVAASNLLLLVAILQGAQPTVLGGFVTVVSWANVFFLIRGRHARQAARARPHLDAARLLSGQRESAPARMASGGTAIASLPTRVATDDAKAEEPELDERSLVQTDLDDFDARLREAERRKAAK